MSTPLQYNASFTQEFYFQSNDASISRQKAVEMENGSGFQNKNFFFTLKYKLYTSNVLQ